ncbi:sulfatase-like hydrolase/transferase [Helicobacter sp. 23-1045]
MPYAESPLFSYSKNGKNIVVIVLDAFSGSHTPFLFEQFSHFKAQLDGWTLYPNAISSTNSTVHSIATLIGGEYYAVYNMNKRAQNLAAQIDSAFADSANAFARGGFQTSLMAFVGTKTNALALNNGVFAIDADDGAFKNYYIYTQKLLQNVDTSNSFGAMLGRMLNFGLFKIAPTHFRADVYNEGRWLFSKDSRLLNALASINYSASFYAFTHNLRVDSANPTFKYLHSMMTHSPYQMHFKDDKCEFFSTKSAWEDYPHKAKGHPSQQYDTEACALRYLSDFVANLKNAGIYDNTQIFVISDHGGNSVNMPIPSRADALFLFKDFGASGALKVDNRLMANFDIASIFCANLPNGCPNVGQNILQNYPQNRELIHTIPSAWQLQKHKKNAWYITKAYKVSDSIYEAKNWTDISDKTQGIVNVK